MRPTQGWTYTLTWYAMVALISSLIGSWGLFAGFCVVDLILESERRRRGVRSALRGEVVGD